MKGEALGVKERFGGRYCEAKGIQYPWGEGRKASEGKGYEEVLTE